MYKTAPTAQIPPSIPAVVFINLPSGKEKKKQKKKKQKAGVLEQLQHESASTFLFIFVSKRFHFEIRVIGGIFKY